MASFFNSSKENSHTAGQVRFPAPTLSVLSAARRFVLADGGATVAAAIRRTEGFAQLDCRVLR